jgi:adenylate cyclase
VLLGREVLLRDLGSTNGTYVNGVQVGEVALKDGDVVRIGGTALTFRSG